MSEEHNPPVSPIIIGEKLFDEGMSLRDYFAGQALAGLSANYEWLEKTMKAVGAGNLAGSLAGSSYTVADAMLAARKAKP